MRRLAILISAAVLVFALRGICAGEVHELTFPSGETKLGALLLTPDSGSTDTLLVYLHGNPGRPLEPADWLVGPLLEEGVAVFQFNYRGLWGNAGDFNLANAIGDLGSALSFLTAPGALRKYGVTPERIVLLGYSFGTAVALSGGHDEDRVAAIASFAPCDHGYFGAEYADPESPLRGFLDAVVEELFGEGRPIEQDAAIFTDDLVENSAEYRFPHRAVTLRDKKLLFLVGLEDEICFAEDHFFPLYRELESVSHPSTEVVVLPMDHGADPVGLDEVAARVAAWVAASGREELSTIGGQIDSAVWEVISATVAANDAEGMAAVYHSDAVLVSPRGTASIAEQLVKWGEGMERFEREGRSATVAFRFSSRQDDAKTAFERGMFRYAETDENGVEQPAFIPFEALLVKQDGRWLMVMERQLEATDEAAWDALGSLDE